MSRGPAAACFHTGLLIMLTLGSYAAIKAVAAPPAAGSEDYTVMHPYSEWVTSRHDHAGYWCCSLADGRPVDARIAGSHWEAHVTPAKWAGETDRWVVVPDDKLVTGGNPTGMPILWLLHGVIRCFVPPDGV